MIWFATIALLAPATGPLQIGSSELDMAAGSHRKDVELVVKPTGSPEAYTITAKGGKVRIVGSDPTGAMYGAFEFAERLHNHGATAWTESTSGKPFLPQRGLNLFLTLPWDYKKNDTDDAPAALVDPDRWWFQNENYWSTLLDLMAHSRLNWLDIHGAWDISVTNAPNLYAYFVTSPSFPAVGVEPNVKAACMKRLNWIIAMAHQRGIRVSLMAYEANLKIPQNPKPPYDASEANVYTYTKECVEQMIRQAPGLDAIGFRIGESGRSESFFRCYTEAVKASGRDIPLITRSWITTKQRVLPLARSSKDFTVEVKYNGEQWGAPYIVAGGRMANWGSYSYEDYLSDSGDAPSASRWPGWPAKGGAWPSEPYKIVWQVRANGTHRIFPFYNPAMVRSSILAMKIGTTTGYTVEGEDAYFPKSPEYYLADPKTKYCDWIHQRDEMYWMTWGRLGYDPNVPDSVFDNHLRRWFGSQTEAVADLWKTASSVVPLVYSSHSLGPDHRDDAPELETGGSVDDFIQGDPFDPLVFRSVREESAFAHLGIEDGRRPPWTVAVQLRRLAEEIEGRLSGPLPSRLIVNHRVLGPRIVADEIPDAGRARFDEIETAGHMLSYLAQYDDAKLSAAQAVAGHGPAATHDHDAETLQPILDRIVNSWRMLASSPAAKRYRPFTDRLRMHTNEFHWSNLLDEVRRDARTVAGSISTLRDGMVRTPPTSARLPNASMWSDDELTWSVHSGAVRCELPGRFKNAWLLEKPLPSSTFFHRLPMKKIGDHWVAEFPREPYGHCIAGVGQDGDAFVHLPGTTDDPGAPYLVIPAEAKPTPQIYSTSEALTYLDPKDLDPAKYGTILIAPRAAQFFRFDRAMKRKLLEPVQRGMNLVILQQDFLANRYKLDFLPSPPAIEVNPNPGLFDAGGALGLPRIETHDIQLQRFVPTPGWEIAGSGGVAHRALGRGHIWIVAARLMQRMTFAPAANALAQLLRHNGGTKPVVVLDAGTETNNYVTSLFPDMLNALQVPFLTLGEVIAKEQGMNSFQPIAGPVGDDDLLGGQGTAMANAFLLKRVKEMARRPDPASLEEFEKIREVRRKELMRCLGLDPMPPRTPLNARVTGTIQRDGYRIEKLVFESRPRFFVTAHVYVPDHPTVARMPVIVHVNGHWAHKKDEDRIQLRCAFCAKQGYLSIALDSPGWSFEGNSLFERKAEGPHNDYALVEGGSNATGYYVWDAIRALDYMETRPDADMTRVGITGASGGGLATLYTFAADSRYKAAVPVVYMASLELAPDNGCLCNHVPGTLQIGDRSDVLAIQAPKPVYIMGAEQDGEFPPEAMRLTHTKLQPTWRLFGKERDTYVQVFAGGHDYNQPMREAMIGFFNRYLKGEGDGSPVAQPALAAIDPQDRQLLALDPPATDERTMRALSQEYLEQARTASAAQVFAVNGGLPERTDLHYTEIGDGARRLVRLEPMPGLVTPGILYLPSGPAKGVRIIVADIGKQAEIERAGLGASDGYALLYLDILGVGELSGIEMRYPVYMGASPAFLGGWQIARASEAVRHLSERVEAVGLGPLSSQAVMYAGLMNPSLAKVTGYQCMRQWSDAFLPGFPDVAIQPRANLCGSLNALRAQITHGEWHVEPDR